MSFSGTPVVTAISDALARITGITLADLQTGTISLAVGTGEIKLPASLQWGPYGRFDDPDGVVNLEESVQVWFVFVEDPGDEYGPSSRISIAKSGGDSAEDFLITFTNSFGGEGVVQSAEMEIYVRFH